MNRNYEQHRAEDEPSSIAAAEIVLGGHEHRGESQRCAEQKICLFMWFISAQNNRRK